MKYFVSSALLYLFVSYSLLAQEDLFKKGMEAYNQKNYLNSLILFGETLEHKYLISGKDLPRAYCYRAKSIINIYEQAISKNDTFMMSRFPDMLVVAYDDLDEAKKFDNGKMKSMLKETFEDLGQITIWFCQTVAKQLRLDFHHKNEVDSLLGVIKDELVLLERHQFRNQGYLDLLGLIEYKSKNYELAESYFRESRSMPEDGSVDLLDIDHLYSYYYDGLIKYHENHEFEDALINVKEAKKRLFLTQTSFKDSVYALDHSQLVSKLEDLEIRLELLVN
ncbi:MAG: hypothetical protein ABJF04_08175 [Reichenbachiella sp.]|uniref:hypothetical protein n=1 Tax=Reichenbachiella sp. TaxID=2184521 RepID=UPI00326395DA